MSDQVAAAAAAVSNIETENSFADLEVHELHARLTAIEAPIEEQSLAVKLIDEAVETVQTALKHGEDELSNIEKARQQWEEEKQASIAGIAQSRISTNNELGKATEELARAMAELDELRKLHEERSNERSEEETQGLVKLEELQQAINSIMRVCADLHECINSHGDGEQWVERLETLEAMLESRTKPKGLALVERLVGPNTSKFVEQVAAAKRGPSPANEAEKTAEGVPHHTPAERLKLNPRKNRPVGSFDETRRTRSWAHTLESSVQGEAKRRRQLGKKEVLASSVQSLDVTDESAAEGREGQSEVANTTNDESEGLIKDGSEVVYEQKLEVEKGEDYSTTTCSGCTDPSDREEIVLCDDCDKGFHLSCVGLTEVPSGSFFCPKCNKKRLSKQKREMKRAALKLAKEAAAPSASSTGRKKMATKAKKRMSSESNAKGKARHEFEASFPLPKSKGHKAMSRWTWQAYEASIETTLPKPLAAPRSSFRGILLPKAAKKSAIDLSLNSDCGE